MFLLCLHWHLSFAFLAAYFLGCLAHCSGAQHIGRGERASVPFNPSLDRTGREFLFLRIDYRCHHNTSRCGNIGES
jgi:hypothetical protein